MCITATDGDGVTAADAMVNGRDASVIPTAVRAHPARAVSDAVCDRCPTVDVDARQPSVTVRRMLRGVTPSAYVAADDRYDAMQYRRCGRRGLQLPVLSLGLWHNFGHDRPYETQRAIVRRAFDLGITHIDLANNYGPPYGSAEVNFGRMLADDLRPYRDELVISTKAGYDMWPGPYGEWGSRKYLLASLDQSLARMGVDYVDIFYSHRFDPETPLEETMGALDTAVRSGRALYVGISSYNSERTRQAAAILSDLGTPLLISQPSYSMINRWIEEDRLLDTLEEVGAGCIAFSPLAQGLLTDRYLDGVPADSRVATGGAMGQRHAHGGPVGPGAGAQRGRRETRPEPRPAGPRRGPCATHG